MKMEEWKECSIGDICSKITSGGTPKSSNSSYYNGSIPWLNTKEVNFNRIYSTEKTITQDGYDNSSAKWIPENSVIVAMYGATAGRVAISKIELTTNQACCNLIVDSSKADYQFVYYHLYNSYTHLSSLANGGAQQNLNANQIREYPIKLPPLPTQQKIAAILSSLDDKIELNNKININLEQQAQALFKNWFVDFEPFGGKMPEGWKVGKLCDISDYSSEKIEINKLTPETYYSTENMLPSKGGIETATSLPSISQTTRCLPGETIISNIRPYFKKIFYCTEEVAGCSTDVLCFKPKNKDYSEYLYQVLYSDIFFDYMVLGSKGTKMPRGDKQQIMNYTITIPDELYLHKYKTFAKPILSQIDTNRKENKRLSEIRDTLLPKLMNGEIRQY